MLHGKHRSEKNHYLVHKVYFTLHNLGNLFSTLFKLYCTNRTLQNTSYNKNPTVILLLHPSVIPCLKGNKTPFRFMHLNVQFGALFIKQGVGGGEGNTRVACHSFSAFRSHSSQNLSSQDIQKRWDMLVSLPLGISYTTLKRHSSDCLIGKQYYKARPRDITEIMLKAV